MPKTIKELSEIIANRTREEWDLTHEPYLLSKIPAALQGDSYREIIAPQTLKQFVISLTDTVQLVQHPIQKAKIGLIPKGENYSFSDFDRGAATSASDDKTKVSYRNQKYIVLNFLEALSNLDAEDLEKIQIPVSVLVRLLR